MMSELPDWVVERLSQAIYESPGHLSSDFTYEAKAALAAFLAIIKERGLRIVPMDSVEGDCPSCGGSGWYVTPVCCGRPSPHGDCCGNPDPGRAPCQECCGGGRVQYCPAPPLAELLETPDAD